VHPRIKVSTFPISGTRLSDTTFLAISDSISFDSTIETNFEVRISATTGKSIFKTNVGLSDFEFSLSNIEFTKENPWNFALTALKNTLSAADSIEKNSVSKILSSSPEISLEIVSDLGFGENKKARDQVLQSFVV